MVELARFSGLAFVVLATLMGVAFLLQRRFRDAGIVDVAFAFGFGGAGVAAALAFDGDATRRSLLAVLCGAWGVRLGIHLAASRVFRGHEDGRYATLRARWGGRAQSRFFAFFQIQALLVALLVLAPAVVARDTRSFPAPYDVAALALYVTSVVGEAVADRQLARFRADARHHGMTCRVGLWSVSRHPNYFFEWLHWIAYGVWALGAPSAWHVALAWAPAALMLFLMLKVSGIPPTEAQALRSRGDDYRRYQREVSAFVPWPARRAPAASGFA